MGALLAQFFDLFSDLVSGSLLARMLVHFEAVLGPNGSLKTAKKRSGVVRFRVFEFLPEAGFRKPFWEAFWERFGSRNRSQIGPETVRKTSPNLKPEKVAPGTV